MAIKIGINGFGRIGRLVFRIIAETHKDIEIVAINDLVPADNLAYLLKYDTVHRQANFDVRAEDNALIVNEKKTLVCSERDPANLPWNPQVYSQVRKMQQNIFKQALKELSLQHPEKGISLHLLWVLTMRHMIQKIIP